MEVISLAYVVWQSQGSLGQTQAAKSPANGGASWKLLLGCFLCPQ